jgi:hypothetical protein
MNYIKTFNEFKLFEEFVNTPIPGDAPPEKKLIVMDFDDTLAVSKNANGIALFKDGKPAHHNQQEVSTWLKHLGLSKDDLLKGPNGKSIEETPNTKIWTAYITSGALAKAKTNKDLTNKHITGSGEVPEKGETLVIDFTPSSFIGRAKPIDPVISKLKQAEAEGAETVVMTARKGEGEGTSMDGKTVHHSNIKDVKAYLKSKGASPDEVLGVSGKNKGEKIKDEFFDGKDDPEEVHFYDDDEDNIDSVKHALAGKVDAELFTYGPGKFDKKEADPNKPTSKYPAKKK